MQLQLTEKQIDRARSLRAEGKTYAEIKADLQTDLEADTIRQHCLDVPVTGKNGKIRTRTDSGPRKGKDGRTITPYRPDEDALIIAWARAGDDNRTTMAALAKDLGRLQHSVSARIKTLRKHGRIPG